MSTPFRKRCQSECARRARTAHQVIFVEGGVDGEISALRLNLHSHN